MTGADVEHHGGAARRATAAPDAVRLGDDVDPRSAMTPDPRDPRLMGGTAVADALLRSTATRAEAFARAAGRRPSLATVLVGDDPASVTYVRMKRRRAQAVGIDTTLLPPSPRRADRVVAAAERGWGR